MKYFKFTLLVFAVNSVFAQNGFTIKEGQKLKVHSNNFFIMLDANEQKKIDKLKGDEKAKAIDAINQEFISGKRPNTYGSKSATDMLVEKVVSNDKGQRMVTTMETPGKKWYFVSAFKNDTFYFSRNSDPVFAVVNGDTLGFSIQGIKEFPAKITPGSSLKKYYDYGIYADKSADVQIKKQVYSHMASKTTIERNTFGLDTRTGQFGYGDFEVTKTHAVYNSIDVAARKQFQGTMHIIGYAVSNISEKTPITVHGKTYDAYIVTSETWTKNNAKFVFESEDKAVEAQSNEASDKLAQKAREEQIKQGLLNKDGYSVSKIKEWYVPGIGVVRTENYDAKGFISAIMTVEYL